MWDFLGQRSWGSFFNEGIGPSRELGKNPFLVCWDLGGWEWQHVVAIGKLVNSYGSNGKTVVVGCCYHQKRLWEEAFYRCHRSQGKRKKESLQKNIHGVHQLVLKDILLLQRFQTLRVAKTGSSIQRLHKRIILQNWRANCAEKYGKTGKPPLPYQNLACFLLLRVCTHARQR